MTSFHAELQRKSLHFGGGKQPRVKCAFGPLDLTPAVIVGPPSTSECPNPCATHSERLVDHDGSLLSAFGEQTFGCPGEVLYVLCKLLRLKRVFGGPFSRAASHERNPVQLRKSLPVKPAGHPPGAYHGSPGIDTGVVPLSLRSSRTDCL